MLLYAPKSIPAGAVIFPHTGSRLEVVDHEGHAAILDVPAGDEFAIRDLGFTDAQPAEKATPAEDGAPVQPAEPVAEDPHEEGEMLPPVAEHREGEGQ